MNNSSPPTLAQRIHEALPQTQCTRCGYPDCLTYAKAIAQGDVAINQCPPGGAEGIERLAALTGQPAIPLNPANGQEGPRSIAVIDESWCIGCTLCLPVCPTDAILGANKLIHTVIEGSCTGCELCVAVCPVDCISLENVSGNKTGWAAWSPAQAHIALQRYELHRQRLNMLDSSYRAFKQPAAGTDAKNQAPSDAAHADRKQDMIKAALASARKKAEAQKP